MPTKCLGAYWYNTCVGRTWLDPYNGLSFRTESCISSFQVISSARTRNGKNATNSGRSRFRNKTKTPGTWVSLPWYCTPTPLEDSYALKGLEKISNGISALFKMWLQAIASWTLDNLNLHDVSRSRLDDRKDRLWKKDLEALALILKLKVSSVFPHFQASVYWNLYRIRIRNTSRIFIKL